MPVRSAPPADVVALARTVLAAAHGLSAPAARAALVAMAQDRGWPVTRCAEFVVATVGGKASR
ncbi:hypothetical protein [Amycolatopsis sp. FDAARGOS 1241]|uniref:hypothetical protein n=1 Tax=Amycolatopsis sp. FDAARGOS 1241 TaxID=2778070 RepID=UPI00194F4D11|nr:hypothetical protein [Amycolatopsis sp. FDAARGOS 1241]QRP50133.1 hypothetical protein I6J71_21955 [Amycolatopsis sp. FDAARGOS 1241]